MATAAAATILPSASSSAPASPLARLAWVTLLFNLLTIIWGALVRASGSGAGCGRHWPLCNGEVIPHTGQLSTAIEFVHRGMSGACLILAASVAALGVRHAARGSALRKATWGVLGFTLSEALVGAGLVLLRYVDKDQSVGRVVSICLHLSNTFLLLACLALTAWWSTYTPGYRLQPASVRSPRLWRTALLALGATLVLGITGALTALGDTLFHATSLAGGVTQDFASGSHFLVKLRILHPILAVLTAAWVFYFSEKASELPGLDARLPTALKALVAAQLLVGMVNLVLLAPTSLQLVHLGVAECLWVVLVLTVAQALAQPGLGAPTT